MNKRLIYRSISRILKRGLEPYRWRRERQERRLRRNLRNGFSWRKSPEGKNLENYGSRKVTRIQVFFHRMANCHRKRSNLSKIKINGSWIDEKREI